MKSIPEMKIGDRIRYFRESLGISQQELAHRLGIGQTQISEYETGKRNPKQATMSKIAKALEIPALLLLDKTLFDEFYELYETPPINMHDYFGEFPVLQNITEDLKKAVQQLNRDGQKKVIEYAKDLSEIPRYQRGPAPDPKQEQTE